MLSSGLRPALRGQVLRAVASGASPAAARQFSSTPVPEATLRELEHRIKSVKNIEKITKSMKMIATTRLGKAQRTMNEAKGYGAANSVIFQESKAGGEGGAKASKILYLVISSDRGLCGGIHSSVSKRAKREMAEGEGKDAEKSSVVILGDKPKAQLSRSMPSKIELSFNQIGRAVPTFADALAVADLIEENKIEYDKINLIYNKFISALSYEATITEVFDAEALKKSPNFAAYELEDDELVKELVNFSLANAIYVALVEGHAAEISARRNAMDSASKNAGEMIQKLTQQFNTKRQGAITNDLVDIITGANAL